MTPEEYFELLNYIHSNNGWKHTLFRSDDIETEKDKNRPLIKYIRSDFDTRDGKIYHITFNHGINFRIESKEDIEKLYKWLRGEEIAKWWA